MDFIHIDSPGAALAAGLVTSLHCAGMCGPLACWLSPVKTKEDPTLIFSTYQVTRLMSYTLLGAAAGGLGGLPLAWLGTTFLRYLPWALVIFFLVTAFRLHRNLRRPLVLVRMGFRVQGWVQGRSRVSAAAILGTATPLLPCGPLYLVAALAALSGSAARGASFLLAFGLGTLPLLWFTQTQFGWLRSKIPARWIGRVQAAMALIAAAVISWRLRGTLGGASPEPGNWVCF
jgi:uncharacterized protein